MSPVIGFSLAKGHPESIENYIYRFKYVWLEGMMDVRLAFLVDVPDWNDLTQWPAGRLFGEEGEYRWQRNSDETIHVILILDTGDLPKDFCGKLEIEKGGEDAAMILWGKWVDPEKDSNGNPTSGPFFYAKEIPQIQSYPLKPEEVKGETPRLVVRRYKHKPKDDEKSYEGEFIRCVSVCMRAEEEEHDAN